VDSELIEVARALIDARTDDANHTTGAAARTASGRIITGVNVSTSPAGRARNWS
jgi:cytidine deaminase